MATVGGPEEDSCPNNIESSVMIISKITDVRIESSVVVKGMKWMYNTDSIEFDE